MRMAMIVSIRALSVLLVVSLTGCFHPPNTATADSAPPPPSVTPPTDATPLATLIKERNIVSLNPDSTVPLLDQTMVELGKSDVAGRYRGITYDLTHGNSLAPGWLIQTPRMWDRSAASRVSFPVRCTNCDPDFRLPICRSDADCGETGAHCGRLEAFAARRDLVGKKLCLGESDRAIDRWYSLIAGAQEAVDITQLAPAPDVRFLAALRDAITMLARSRRAVVLRVLVGQYPPDNVDTKALLDDLIRDARSVPGSRLTVYAAAMRSCSATPGCSSLSWNHAKILAVDGRRALVGGHNFRTADYLDADPIHDISMMLAGPAAADAHRFADQLWGFVCANAGSDPEVTSLEYRAGAAAVGAGCLPAIQITKPAKNRAAGRVSVLAIGRLASGITTDFANQSELARDLLLGAARRTMLIVQQDIGFFLPGVPGFTYPAGVTYPESTLERIADFLLGGGDAYIVLSNYGAVGLSTAGYSNDIPIADVARKIRAVAQSRTKLAAADLDALLCQHLHLAPLRFGPDAAWPDGHPIGEHGKFWMVDDHVFYIGSDNMYPADLQEFGYIVDDRAAASTMWRDYWEPLWKWSSLAAISGSEAASCVFHDPAPSSSAPGPSARLRATKLSLK
jgi:phosphatidylserine/phosphatidylglycerophosphate/cardiolipin synthase-like enzyme